MARASKSWRSQGMRGAHRMIENVKVEDIGMSFPQTPDKRMVSFTLTRVDDGNTENLYVELTPREAEELVRQITYYRDYYGF